MPPSDQDTSEHERLREQFEAKLALLEARFSAGEKNGGGLSRGTLAAGFGGALGLLFTLIFSLNTITSGEISSLKEATNKVEIRLGAEADRAERRLIEVQQAAEAQRLRQITAAEEKVTLQIGAVDQRLSASLTAIQTQLRETAADAVHRDELLATKEQLSSSIAAQHDNIDQIRKDIVSINADLIRRRGEFVEMGEYRAQVNGLIAMDLTKLPTVQFEAWKSERDKTISMMQSHLDALSAVLLKRAQ